MAEIEDPSPNFSGSGPVDYRPAAHEPSGALERLLAKEEARLLAIPGVTSVGIGLGSAGGEALAVGVEQAQVAARLPRAIDGVPVVVTVTGPIEALPQG